MAPRYPWRKASAPERRRSRCAHDRCARRHRDGLPSISRVTAFCAIAAVECRNRFHCIRAMVVSPADSSEWAGVRPEGAGLAKSSGKYRTALNTGYGVNPPSAQSDPSSQQFAQVVQQLPNSLCGPGWQ